MPKVSLLGVFEYVSIGKQTEVSFVSKIFLRYIVAVFCWFMELYWHKRK